MNGILPTLTWGTWDYDNDSAPPNDILSNSKAVQCVVPSKIWRKQSKNSQPWFEELLERVENTRLGRKKANYRCNPLSCLHMSTYSISKTTEGIPWADMPDGIHPRDGKLPKQRVRNKRQQVENLAIFLRRILRPGDVVVEFCAGSGYVALPLACLFPQCTFVLLDKKVASLAIAQERIATAQLTNVKIFCGFICDYHEPFDVGIALHACGEATDLVMQKCVVERAAYVLAPCCVGKIKSSMLAYPRSVTLAAELTRTEYEVLAKAADFGHSSCAAVAQMEINLKRRRCKTILESDRNMYAEEAQYDTFMFIMHPPTATPKNDVLVGIPRILAVGQTIVESLAKDNNRRFSLACKEVYR